MSFDASPIALAPPKLRVLTTKQRSRPSGRAIATLLVPAIAPPGADAKPAGDGAHLEDRIEIGRARIPPCPVIDQLLNGDGREARRSRKRGAVETEPGKNLKTQFELLCLQQFVDYRRGESLAGSTSTWELGAQCSQHPPLRPRPVRQKLS